MRHNILFDTDIPDPDVIFHDGYYYLITTTMHFFPGGEILRSPDLKTWEHFSYVFSFLEKSGSQRLEGEEHIYGKGMWAPSLRFYDGVFYVVFSSNDTKKTCLFRSSDLKGPWVRNEIKGFYHDPSLLFDDGKAFLFYGNTDIHLTELNNGLTAPKEGGTDRVIISEENGFLGYEGSHAYKIGGKYHVFLIHSLKDRWRRVEACFSSDRIDGPYEGGDVYDDDLGIRDSGIAQGGIVQGTDGTFSAVMFQDSGAVGRIPVIVPVRMDDGRPVFGTGDREVIRATVKGIYGSDNFESGLKDFWQFNHEPDMDLIRVDHGLKIRTDKTSGNIFHAKNTVTQRMNTPSCSSEVTICASGINEGDVACLAAFIGDFALVGITKREDGYYAVMMSNESQGGIFDLSEDTMITEELIKLDEDILTVGISCDFAEDTASCYVKLNGRPVPVGKPHAMRFRLDHFTGARFALSYYSTKIFGGEAVFTGFVRE